MWSEEANEKRRATMKKASTNVKYFGHLRWEKPQAHTIHSLLMKTHPKNIANWHKHNPERSQEISRSNAYKMLAATRHRRKIIGVKIALALKRKWANDPEFRRKHLAISLANLGPGRGIHAGKRTFYRSTVFRSKLEAAFAANMDRLGLKWEYEPLTIRYWHKGICKNYIIDFFLPDLDVYIEVKPRYFASNQETLSKLHGAKLAGLNISVCTEEDIEHLIQLVKIMSERKPKRFAQTGTGDGI